MRGELRQRLRQLAEDNVERARKLYLQFMGGSHRLIDVFSRQGSSRLQRNPRAGDKNHARECGCRFNLARDVANANDLQELVTLQTRYVQSQMKWYAQQTQEFGRLMAKSLRGAQSSTPGED
jgi:hypothetical protein